MASNAPDPRASSDESDSDYQPAEEELEDDDETLAQAYLEQLLGGRLEDGDSDDGDGEEG